MVVLALFVVGGAQGLLADTALAGPCDPPNNEIVCENSKAGTSPSVWDVNGAGASNIQGFSTDISVDQGGTIGFKVNTVSSDYRLDIYRMGYYGGNGARKVATVQPSASLPQSQPACAKEASTGLVDCGNWSLSASWAVPASAVSGIYFAKLEREDASSEGSHIVFIVRDDNGDSKLLFQTSDTTWQAYNQYGGNSLYVGGPGSNPSRAYKVSYNRPLTTRQTTSEDSPFNAEYPMVRWLERNGYDISYSTGVDTARRGAELLEHEVFLSVGHDEYWSAEQRDNVEAARDAGVHLAFFSGNELFWKTRWEPSIGGASTNHRTLVCYKETHFNGNLDPDPDTWTGTWRDPRFSPPADGGEVENALSGTAFMVNAGTTEIKVPADDAAMRLWRDTSVAELAPGQTATLAEDTLGYEWDEDLVNGTRPHGLVHLSSTTTDVPQKLQDYGNSYASGTATHHVTLYRAASGALVFGAGTVQWSWGLDSEHDRGGGPADPRMQQATVNLFADMGVQPGTLQAGLTAATQTSDADPPQTTILSPTEGAAVELGQTVTITGAASDSEGEGNSGGEVGAVEVSVDGGDTWRPAQGRDAWSYSWTPKGLGEATVLARAADDSGNLGAGDQLAVEVAAASCPCTIWDEGVTGPQDNDSKAVELGTKFRSDVDGFVTGVRYYRTPNNTGPHSGRLWTRTGTQLAQVSFSGESSSGWQQANFDTPVAISANTTYVVSYHAPAGKYAAIKNYFSVVGVDNPPLHALATGVDGPNGIYEYGSAGGLFADGTPSSFQAESYLVDVVFEEEIAPDTKAPLINDRTPPPGATEVSTGTTVTAGFNEPMNPASIDGTRVELRNPANQIVPATVGYNAAERRVTLTPSSALQLETTYTAKVKGGPGGVTDVAGNALAADSTWSFTTVPPPPPPPDEGPGGPILVIANEANPFSRYYGEILRAEGLNQFTVTDISKVTPALLAARDVAILGEGALSAAQATTLGNWVQSGGNLIAMRPDSDLNSLLGLTPVGGTLANAYLAVDTGSAPGAGIVADTIQYHGTADRYTLNGAQAVATLYSSAATATANPAVTVRSVGTNGGQAAAFAYDLARSVVYTRQGNPAWAGQERDGLSPIRSDDLFFGAKAGDAQADWVDLSKVAIPQADEQQRLLGNLIGEINLDRKPLPRFWFLPRDEKAAVVMTGDDHAQGGTAGRLESYKALGPPGCDVDAWECVRSTSYLIPNNPLLPAKAASLVADGFEIAVHTSTGCQDWTGEAELLDDFEDQLETFANNYPSLPPPSTNRMHCIVWSDWASQAKVSVKTGVRFDTNYYYWPGSWVGNRPGMFTGSGMPMRFADLDGSLIDVYQATTQMTDESGQTYPFTSDTLLDRALGPEQYFGVFTANMHTDDVASPSSDAIVASAQARGVPVVSARQMLSWIDGRNQSSFGSIGWSGDELSFTIAPGAGANGLRAMVPTESSSGPLDQVARGGTPVAITTQVIKGVEYAFFDAVAGSYTATYLEDSLPFISNVQATAGSDGTATITWETDEPASSRVDYGTDPESLTSSKSNAALVTSHSIQLTGLSTNATYHFRVTSTDNEAKSTTKPNPPLAPQSFLTPPPAPTLSSTVPASPSNLNTPKVLGSAAAGSTVRIYGTADCSGSPLATGTAAGLATGIEVTVGENATTALRATAATAGGTSTCSAAISYVEDSTAPPVQIDTGPTGLTNDSTPTYTFSSEPGAIFACSIDTGTASFVPCSGAGTHTPVSPLNDGPRTFRARATDAAGNQAIATRAFNVDATPPDTTIGTKPNALTNSTTADFTFSGSDPGGSGVASFECRLDSGSFVPCTTPRQYTGLTPGAHSLEVRAVDNATNADSTPALHTWTIDTTAPTVTADSLSKALLKAGESANLTWHANENGNFQLRVGGADCDTGTVIDSGAYSTQPNTRVSPVAAAQLAEGANALRLCLTDAAGNRAQASTTIAKDTGLPDTSIGALKPPALAASTTADFAFSGSDVGGSGVASFECKLDSGAFIPCTSPRQYTGLGQGAHKLEVRTIDQAGNADGSPASHEWTVDTVAPTTAITAQPPAVSASQLASFGFNGADPGGSGVDSFECRRDSQAPGDWQPCKSTLNYNSLAEGMHSFEVRAIDKAGNVDPNPPSYEWRVDTVAPDTSLGTRPNALTNSTTADFTFSGSDPGGSGVASFECKLDSGAFSPCTTPLKLTGLTPGAHSLEVRAIDQAGNADGGPATHAWTIDTTAPTITADSLSKALLKAGETSDLTWHANENGNFALRVGGADCDTGTVIDSGAYSTQPNTRVSTVNASALAEGANALRLCLTDAAGNRGQATTSIAKDTGLPDTTITALKPPALTNSTEAELGFTGSDGGSGVASFECKLDSGSFEPCSSPRKYTGLSQGSHTFEVRAIDQAGNADTTPALHTWTIDTTAPTVIADSLSKALLKAGESANLTWHANENGSFALRVGGADCDTGTVIDSGAYSTQPNTRVSPVAAAALAEGANTLRLCLTDAAGNRGSATQAISRDTGLPDTSLGAKPNALTNSTTADFTFTGSDVGGSGVASFECKLDDGAFAPCSSPRQYTGLGQGSHSFEVRAIDQAGNGDGSPAVHAWTVDSVAPDTQITASPDPFVNSSTANFTFTGSDPGGSGIDLFQCRRDSEEAVDWQPCTAPLKYASLADGPHSFQVRAIDNAGNPDPDPATVIWTIDTVAPNTQITTKPAAVTSATAAELGFSGSDPGGSGVTSFECRLDSSAPGAWAPCTNPRQHTDLGEGNHLFEVRSIDKAGNVDGEPASHAWEIDLTPPAVQVDSGPSGLTKNPTPTFTFSSEPGAAFACSIDNGTPNFAPCSGAGSHTPASPLADGPWTFRVRASDPATNQAVATRGFTVDTATPDPPELSHTVPASPANHNNPKVFGSAPAGTTVRLFAGSTCTGAPLATVPAAALAAGIEVTVSSDTSTSFSAIATSTSDNDSDCSAALTYLEDSTAPDTAIGSKPPTPVNSAAASFSFSGEDGAGSGIASFQCKLDGGSFGACTSPQAYSGLQEGSHTFQVRAIDAAGNLDGEPASHAWLVDLTPPAVQVDFGPAGFTANQTPTFTFSSEPGAAFACSIDNGSADFAPCSGAGTHTPASPLPDGPYTFRVRATDGAGNQAVATRSFTVDATAPETQITAQPPALTSLADASFSFTGSDPGGSGVASFECKLDDGAWGDCTNPRQYTGLEQGSHSFQVRAIDQADNPDGEPASHTWEIDLTPPAVQVDTGPTGLTNDSTPTFAFSSEPGASFECSIDTGTSNFASCSGAGTHTPASPLSDGPRTFRVRATDPATNQAVATRAFTVDATAPDTSIGAQPNTPTNSTEAEFGFTGSDPGGSGIADFECKLDSGAFESCPTPRKYTGLGQGGHKFEVRAIDQAGNVDGSPSTHVWTVDTTPPSIQVDAGPDGFTANQTPTFTFSSEPGASFACSVDTGTPNFAPCSGTGTHTPAAPLADGPKTFRVRATDAAGNQAVATRGFTVDATAPDTSIGAQPNTPTNSTEAEFGFTGSDPGGSGIAGFECKLDDGAFAPCSSPRQYTGLGQGSHRFEVRAIDQAGNADGSPATHTWTIDTTAPTVTVDLLSKALLKAGETSDLTWHANGNGNFQLRVGGADCDTGTVIDSGAYSTQPNTRVSTVNASALAEGANALRICLTDAASNRGQATTSISKDTGAPDTSIGALKPPTPTNSTEAEFGFTGSDPGGSGIASFECKLDSGSFEPCSSPRKYTALGQGAHSFEVRAIDQAGNADGSPATHTWTVDTTPPSVSIDTGPTGLTNDSTPTFAFSSEPGATFACSIDTGTADFAPCSGAGTHTPAAPLSDGPYTFRVRATDGATNQAVATRGFSVDTAAPLAPELSATEPASPADHNAPRIIGSAPAGATIRLYRGPECAGAPLATVSTAALEAGVEVSVDDDSTSVFSATATSAAGNLSPCSEPISYVEDSTAPETEITVKPPAVSSSDEASFSFAGSDAGSGIASFECKRDSGAFAPCEPGIELTGLGDGSHEFQVRAIDQAGNADGSPATHTWTIDTTVPTVTADALSKALLKAGETSNLTWHADENGNFALRVGGADCDTGTVIDSGTYSTQPNTRVSPVAAAALAEGANTLRLCLTDAAGNRGSATQAISRDTGAPDTSIGALKPPTPTNSTEAEFGFTGSDPGGSGIASFECKLDSGSFEPCSSPRKYTALGQGAHSFEVRAIDQAGNADGSPATHTWTVDTTPPSVSIDTGPTGLTNDSTPTFAFSSEPGATFACSIDTGTADFAPCSGAGTHTPAAPLSDGPYTFRVRATDGATNQAVATRGFSVDTAAPAAPGLTATVPASPANDNAPKIVGSASAGVIVRLYASADCSGSPLATGSVAELAAGIEVSVGNDTLTQFSATATTAANNTSGCSDPISYREDSTAPETQITTKPAAVTKLTTAELGFTGSDAGGSGVVSFECRLDSSAPGAWTPCTDPRQLADLTPGSHKFEVRAIDSAGNADAEPAAHTWTVDTTPPSVSIDGGPESLTNDPTPTFAFGSEPGATFACSIDTGDADFAPCSGAGTHTPASPLGDGPWTFRVRVTDQAGNQAIATRAFDVDATAPDTEITAQPPALSDSDVASFSFQGIDAGSGVTSFECKLDSGSFAPCAPGIELTDLGEGSHSFHVRAIDSATNADATPDTHTWTVDTVAPETEIESGPDPISTSASAVFTFAGSDDGGSGVASLQCRRDSDEWIACGSPRSFSALAEGSHSFAVRALDLAGNVDPTPAEFEWTIDSQDPDTAITVKPNALTNSTTADFAFSGSDPGGSGIASFECRLDSGAFAPCTTPRQLTALGQGSHSFEVRAIDQAGNVDGSPASHEWTVDTAAPQTSIQSQPPAQTAASAATFAFSGDDGSGSGVASFECRLDSGAAGAWQPCASPREYTSLQQGDHTFEVRAIDAAGNADSTPGSYSWAIDSTPPSVSIDSGPGSATNDSTPTFTFSSEPGATFECSIDTGSVEFGPCSGAGTHTPASPLGEGAYVFRVRAADAVGNAGVATRGFSVDLTVPTAPQLTATDPASPANDNSPRLTGSGPAGTTIRVYGNAGCSGSPLATTTAAELASGITVNVADDTMTLLSATATSVAGNTSACSEPIAYEEDSTAPTVQVDSGPTGATNDPTPTFTFSSEPGATFECSIDTGTADFAPCSGAGTHTPAAPLSDGPYTFRVRAADQVGNQAVATRAFSIDTNPDVETPDDGNGGGKGSTGNPGGDPPSVAATAKYLRVVRDLKTGKAQVVFDVTGPGVLSARPAEIAQASKRLRADSETVRAAARTRQLRLRQRSIKPAIVRVAQPEEVALPIELTAAGKKALKASQALKVKVLIRFETAAGAPATWKLTLTLKKRPASVTKSTRPRGRAAS